VQPSVMPRHPRNVAGPFYTTGGCMACGAPEAEAPALLAELRDDQLETFFVRQPATKEEVEAACRAAQVCCVSSLRYGGQEPAIIRRLGNTPEFCDYLVSDGDIIVPAPLPWPPLPHPSATAAGRLWRILAGLLGLAAGYWMAHLIDLGTTTHWRPILRYSWVIGMLALMFFGVGSLAQVVRPLLGEDEAKWFPERGQIWGPRSAWKVIVVGAILLAVVLVLPWKSIVQARAAVSAMGVILVLMAQIRPDSLWNAGSTRGWRALFGDRATVWLLTTIGVGIAVCSWLVRIAP
jgi:hypothetical protein